MSIIKMILLIGLLIFVHELGHFIVARLFKMKIERFCFGLPFGPVLFEKKIGDVTFGVHLLFFLGGYVSFPDDDKDNGLPPDSPDLFKNKPAYQRALVLLAGVTANIITAYLLVMFCCLNWHKLPIGEYDIYIQKLSENAPLTTVNSGAQEGDRVAFINGRAVIYPHEMQLVAQASKKFDGKVTKEHYKKVLNEVLKLNPELNENSTIEKGELIRLPKTILEDEVTLTDNDIYRLNSKDDSFKLDEKQQKIRNSAYKKVNFVIEEPIKLNDFVVAIADTYSPIDIVVERDGKEVKLPALYSGEDGLIGFYLTSKERMVEIDSLKSAWVNTNNYMIRNTKLMIWSLKMLVTGKVPLSQMRGVVAITKIGADVIEQQGLLKGFLLTAMISLNLAILNILPIPALDGGHLAFLAVEKLRGKPLDESVIEKISMFFFVVLIALMLLLVVSDIWVLWFSK